MNKSESISELITALAAAQAGLSAPPKNRTVTVKTKTGGNYSFSYTTLDCIIEHVRLALTSNGIWFTQTVENAEGKHRLITTLLHSSGQWLASETPLMPSEGGNQAFGSALTYMKRYALAAMLGIASDDDDDGNEADGNIIESRQDRAPPARQSAPPSRTVAPIAAEGKTPAEKWAGDQTKVIRTLTSEQSIGAWKKANKPHLDRLAEKNPNLANQLSDLLDEMLAKTAPIRNAAE